MPCPLSAIKTKESPEFSENISRTSFGMTICPLGPIFTDEDILRAFKVTFKYAIFDVPLKLAFAAAAVLEALSHIAGVQSLNVLHEISPLL